MQYFRAWIWPAKYKNSIIFATSGRNHRGDLYMLTLSLKRPAEGHFIQFLSGPTVKGVRRSELGGFSPGQQGLPFPKPFSWLQVCVDCDSSHTTF